MNKRQKKKEKKKREIFFRLMIFNYTDIRRFDRAFKEYMISMDKRIARISREAEMEV